MTRDELIEKYVNKCNEARIKKDEMRRSYHENRDSNPSEAHWDELEHAAYANEFYLTEEIIGDLKRMS